MADLNDKFLESVLEVGEQLQGEDVSLGLAAVMTKSAFGHEYALMHLKDHTSYFKREEIMAELDAHKKAYFWARDQLEKVNPKKVSELEEELRTQKEAILREKVTVH